MAEACSPALWANADAPTYGARGFCRTWVISATAWEIEVSRVSASGGTRCQPYLSCRLAMTVSRSALPVRSPWPLTVPCTCMAPASTAAIVLATAQPVSLWQWMPRSMPTCAAASTTAPLPPGRMPPLVSQPTRADAPASAAVLTTSMA